MRIKENRRAWTAGIVLSTALWLFLFAFAKIRFAANDDQFLLRTFSWPLGAPTFHLYIHAMYAFPLSWLSRLAPSVPWVTVLEIALMWLSTATIAKSIIQCNRRSFARGLFFAVCFTALFVVYISARLTYTTVAAMLSAACAAQLLSVDCKNATDKEIIKGMAYSLLLLVLCYGLRQMTALPALFFCGLSFAYRFLTCFLSLEAVKRPQNRDSQGAKPLERDPGAAPLAAGGRPLRPMLVTLTAVAVAMGGLAAAREVEITARGQRDYLAWQQARISVLDYINLECLPAEARETAGWTDAQVTLLDNWYTMEESISTETFRYVADTQDNAQTRTSPGAAILDFRTRSPLIALSLVVLFGIGLMCVLGLALKRKGLWTFVALMVTAVGCLALLAYLALQGRLPYRAVMVPVLPAAAVVFCLMPECLPDRKWFVPLLCAVTLAGTAVYAVPTWQDIRYVPPKWDYDTHEAMDKVAKENPDLLFIYSNELVNDLRIWPDMEGGLPTNLMFWGGWQRGSIEYRSKVEAFGLDSDHFTPADWLRPELRFLSLKEEPHPVLVEHLREQLGESLTWEQEKMDIALYAYRFYLNEVEE
ncbi:MAG: hypothetical protein PUD16_10555 [bacterium]|nr:hypothetical protein [bacterium]